MIFEKDELYYNQAIKSSLAKTIHISLVVLIFGLNLRMAKAVDIFDATDDYSISNNPNGVWSSGYRSTLSSQFNLYDANGYSANNYSYWFSSAITPANPPLGTPGFFKNLSTLSILGMLPNQIALHPGPLLEYSILRFTSPKNASFYLELKFFEGDIGETTGNVILNNNSNNPLFYTPSTTNNPTFNSYLNLNQGDYVDIVVGSATSDYRFGTSPITVRFTEQAVPELNSALMGVITTGAFVFAHLRKRIHLNRIAKNQMQGI